MSAQPATETPEHGYPAISSETLAALAVIKIHDLPPASLWAALDMPTRQMWLRVAREGIGHADHAWDGLPPNCQKQLRYVMRHMMAFLASIGISLHKSAAL